MENISPKFLPEKYAFLKSKLSLDLLNMDDELCEIAVITQEASECAVLASEIRDSSKRDWCEVEAIIMAELRKDPDSSGKPRSESRAASEVLLDPRYQHSRAIHGEASLDAGLWDSLHWAVKTKAAAMRASADLISSGFLTNNYILDKRREEIRSVKRT